MDLEPLYVRINDPSSSEKILKATFDPRAWSHWFSMYSSARNSKSIREMRVLIMQGTLRAIDNGRYSLPDGNIIYLPDVDFVKEQVRKTTFYPRTPKFDFPRKFDMKVEAILSDCLDAAFILKENRLNPVVLNMASRSHPGGGYMTGAGAQEENLFRRSNYYQSLKDPQGIDAKREWRYPIPETGGIYCPNVVVFRGSEKNGYNFLPVPTPLSFIAVAAISNPELQRNKNGELTLVESFAERTKRKIQTILSIAATHSHDSVVLGAFGCGAFRNPPAHMARLFQEVLSDFHGCFRHVVFAIIDDHNSKKEHNPKGNFLPFLETFGNEGEASIFNSALGKEVKDVGSSSSSSSKLSLRFSQDDAKRILFSSISPEYSCFTNDSRHEIEIEGKKWATVEHYLQAQRFLLPHHQNEVARLKDPAMCANLINHPSTNSWPTRRDYKENRCNILLAALTAKFTQHLDIQKILLETKGSTLVFDSKVDLFWGFNTIINKGENNLGKALMTVRDKLEQKTPS
eukprot:TRINITY_DN3658_c0_g3_i1.p1 TRINITY_DN3658_c0_g3~~TRINITY_DN3658_c0_g3_i1.p1  ORF type:complete len:582 (+),score=89.91 TRINITY_DN3658_c0_g3_i1:204-1748(+)